MTSGLNPLLRLTLLLGFLLPGAFAIELEIRFPLLEQQLGQQLFTQDGRRYVKGDPKNKCNFAYLAKPHFGGRDGQLVIRATFTGRSSLDVFGKCVGFGDSFDFEIVSAIETKDGTLLLVNPQVRILSKDSFYSRQVGKALQGSIREVVKYPIREELRKVLMAGSSGGAYKFTIRKLEIRSITIQADSFLIDLDTRFLVE